MGNQWVKNKLKRYASVIARKMSGKNVISIIRQLAFYLFLSLQSGTFLGDINVKLSYFKSACSSRAKSWYLSVLDCLLKFGGADVVGVRLFELLTGAPCRVRSITGLYRFLPDPPTIYANIQIIMWCEKLRKGHSYICRYVPYGQCDPW